MDSPRRRRPLRLQTRWTLRHGAALLIAVTVFGLYAYGRIARRMEQDAQLLLELQVNQVLADLDRHGADPSALTAAVQARAVAADPGLKLGIAVFTPDGRPRAAEGSLAKRSVPIPAEVLRGADPQVFGAAHLGGKYGWRVVTQRSPAGIAQVAVYARSFERNVQYVGRIFLVAIPAVIVLSGLAGWWLARTSLRPIAEIAATARRISGANLDERVPRSGTGDELDRLAATLNDTFARLQHSLERTRGFAGDAAHELRTPLAALRSQIEVTLEKERTHDEYRSALAGVSGEVERMALSVQAMLRLARSEAGLDPARRVDVPLATLLAEVAGFFEPVAEDHGVILRVGPLPDATVPGDPEWLHQLFANLLHNAIRYTPAGGVVSLDGEARADEVAVHVRDTGPGIPPEEQDRVFERFHRGGTRPDRPGTGLGLPIAREIARAHGGAIELASEPGRGATFTVRLPRSPG
ncbi:MAG TPA: ATP-binding protein [Myxococcota bacterium]|nr:ATP-binding protein [Myxococcota bacterium]